MTISLSFLGAAKEVTGSCYSVEAEGLRFLVDCGLFQGGSEADRKNRQALAWDLRSLDFVLLTHAHIDHSGLLPRLTAMGYRGPIYATPATRDLLEVMLPDSGHIQEKEAEWENRRRHERRKGGRGDAAPLYTVNQAKECLKRLRPAGYDVPFVPHPRVRCVFRDAGHILGSAIAEVWVTEGRKTRKLVFSGDLGQPGHPLMRDPTPVTEADVLLVESTYGNRLHKSMADTVSELVGALNEALSRGGNVIVPAFSVGRTQDLLYLLAQLSREGRIGTPSVYVDSPLAYAATAITLKHGALLDQDAAAALSWLRGHEGKLRIQFTQTVEESIALNTLRGGAVIISASGMCDAGRIKFHLRHNLPRPESAVLITGFQAAGTLGRRLVDGAKAVRIFGDSVPVRAKIYTIGGLSAHADQAALLSWLDHFRPPRAVYVVHGEADTAAQFAALIRQRLGWNATVPGHGETVPLS